MAGTLQGGKSAAKTNQAKYDEVYKQKYGMTYYQYIGSIGGRKGAADGTIKGFALHPELAKIVGQKGGRISRRRKPEAV